MDPYLERPYWEDFHATFIPCWRRAINDVLPPPYIARIDAKANLIEVDPDDAVGIEPDVGVVRQPSVVKQPRGAGVVTEIEPVIRTLPKYKEIKERWIEIVQGPRDKLVAVVELLSPWNKSAGAGRGEYLAKRLHLIRQAVHLIEVDLLLRGRRLPMAESLPPGDYFAIISRSDRRPKSEVYSWGIPHKLPRIPIPLLAGDADVFCDLAAAFDAAYELGGYAKRIKYTEPPAVPIPEIHRNWVAELAKSARPA
jgi:hypothetical protein